MQRIDLPACKSRDSERCAGLLTPAQEIALARRAEKGDRAAREQFVRANRRLVAAVALRYQGRGVPLEDLIQEGTIGLLRAIDKYNWRRGVRFSTYAIHWIRQAILRAIVNSGRSIRLPSYMVDAGMRLIRLQQELTGSLGRVPSQAELAEAAGMSEEQIDLLLQSLAEPVSLEASRSREDNRSLAETLPAEEDQNPSARVFREAVHTELERALGKLLPREREVLRLRYGLDGQGPRTLEEVGRALHITRERVRQVEGLAMEKLRSRKIGKSLREALIPA